MKNAHIHMYNTVLQNQTNLHVYRR